VIEGQFYSGITFSDIKYLLEKLCWRYSVKLEYENSTEVIKFAVEAYMGVGGNPVMLLKETAEWLFDSYEKTGDGICLKAAKQIVYTYLSMGFLYEEGEAIFSRILKASSEAENTEFLDKLCSNNVLKLKPRQIREVLGRWKKSPEREYNADWIVSDILDKVKNHIYGCWYYRRNREDIVFELVVLEENTYLLDIEKKRVYTLERELERE